VYEACGFRREAMLPERLFKDGVWVDHVVMSVTRENHESAGATAGSTASF
jgi:RimJ/RimL family protein N-acetyltransferase